MTESDSEIEGYVSCDGQSDFDEADTRPSEGNLGRAPAAAAPAWLGLRQPRWRRIQTMNQPMCPILLRKW